MMADEYDQQQWEDDEPREGRVAELGLERREAAALAALKKRLAATEKAHWEGVRRRVETKVLYPTVGTLGRMLAEHRRRTYAHVRHRLGVTMSDMAERHRARWSGLLVPRGGAMVEVASNGYVRRKPGTIDIRGEGIVPLVARTREAYCAAKIEGDPHYRLINPEARSEQAVPIIFEGRLLAVLNQESHVQGRFTPATTKALEQEAASLIPYLLAGAAEEDESAACLWNPDLHGWDAGALLEGILAEVCSSLGPAARAMHLTLWYADPADGVLFSLASTGYGGSFTSARVLPMGGSFAGHCSRLPRREVTDCQVGDEMLMRHEIDEDMGLRRVRAATIRSCSDVAEASPGLVLSIYVFDAEAESSLPSAEELERLAALIEPPIARYLELRSALAAAAVARSLRLCLASDGELTEAAETLKEIMGGEVTVFGLPRASRPGAAAPEAPRLYVAASTAPLGSSPEGGPEIPQVCGGLGRETDYFPGDGTETGDLASRPGSLLRLNRPPSRGGDPDARQLGRHRLYEKLPRVASRFRRCLAYGVRGRSEARSLGVIRVVRSSEGRPFTASDAATLARAAQSCEDALRSWRDRVAATRLPGDAGGERRRLLLPPPRPIIRPARAIAREILEEVHGIVREHLGDCVAQVSALVESADASDRSMRVFEYYSALLPVSAFDGFSPTLPPRFDPCDLRLRGRSWGEFLDAGRAVTFTTGPDPDAAPAKVRAGARVPFQFWCGRYAQRGALSVDLTRSKSFRAVVDDLNLAAQKLALVLTLAGCEAARTAAMAPDPISFVRDLRGRLGASSVSLAAGVASSGPASWSDGAELPREWFGPGSDAPWEMPTVGRAGDVARDPDAARWGVSELRTDSHRYLRIPLRQASGIAATLIVGWEGADDDTDRDSLRSTRIRDALALAGSWLWGLAADEAVEFTPTTGDTEGDSVVWTLGMIDLARLSRRDSFPCVFA